MGHAESRTIQRVSSTTNVWKGAVRRRVEWTERRSVKSDWERWQDERSVMSGMWLNKVRWMGKG
jgi:hypothetical protein